MKTTIDLPDALVKEVKLRARHEGQKLKDAVADLLRIGLATADLGSGAKEPVIKKSKATGLPVIVGGHTVTPQTEMTPDRVAEILLAQEVEWHVSGR